MKKIFDCSNVVSRIDSFPASDHNCVYVTPVEG